MAKITQDAEVVVTLNGQEAKKSIDDLKKHYQELQAELTKLRNTPVGLMSKEDLKRMQQLPKELVKTEKQIVKLEEKTRSFESVIKNINGASLKDLVSASKRLRVEINTLTPGTEKFIQKSKQLKEVNSRLAMLKQGFKGVVEEQKKLSFKSLSESFNHYFGIVTAGIGAITGLSLAFRKAAQAAAELDDTYADVMKTTGLTHNEVASLDNDLMKIDTRTSREQLLLLARDAGKLGISGRQEILGFVRAADQIQVALGEDLGEGAIKQLGKIADVLGYTQQMGVEKSLLSIGSAVNAVGQASTASEAYLVEFVQRLAGVGAQAGISAADLIGFASGLDQSAMKVEMASTAFQKFLMKLYEDPKQFASYAKLEVQEFTDLLNNDANKAITTVLKALQDQDGFASLVPIFKDMGLDGARAVSVLASMASNLGAITDAQALANVEFEKATSVTDEYSVKNNNLQARLEKARKEFQNATITLGQSLNPVLLKSTKGITYLIKLLATYGKEIRNAAIAVAALTVVVKAHTIIQGVANAAVKVWNTLRATATVVTNAGKLAYAKLTGATAAATAAQTALNAAMSASVFGIIALAVAGVTMAITRWVKNSREARAEAQYMEDINKRITEEYSEEAGKIQALNNIVHDNNLAIETRRKALAELVKLVPGYHASLTEEGKLINDNTDALDAYLKKLEMTTRARILEEEYTSATTEVLAAEKELEDAQAKAAALKDKFGGKTTTSYTYTMTVDDQQFEQTTDYINDYGRAVLDVEKKTKAWTAATTKQEAIMSRIRKEEIKKIGTGEDENGGTVDLSLIEAQNEYLTQAQFKLLQERYRKLTKKEKKLVDKGYAALDEEDSQTLKDRYDRFVEADKRLADKRYNDAVKALDNQQRAEQNQAKREYIAGEISAEQYEKRLLDIKYKYLQEKLALAEKEGKDTSAIEQQILDHQINENKAAYDKQLKELEASQKKEETELKQQRAQRKISEEEYESWMLALKMQYLQKKLKLVQDSGLDETTATQAILDAQIEAQEAANKRLDKLREDAQAVKDKLDPQSAQAQEIQTQLDHLAELHEVKLLSEQEYEEAVAQLEQEYAEKNLQMKLQKAQDYIQKSQSFLNAASNFSSALQSMETAQLEAEYQARLTAAGDNAEEREAIEAEYEQKKLDTQKKYADVDMVINIAKTIAAGALAAVQAFAQLGPIAGAVMAAVIAGTTAAEVATIIAQRNAIKNASVSGGGGGGSTPNTGTRTVTGYSDGGYTDNAASDNKPVGVVHANEWVAPAWMVREDPVRFADLEHYRRTKQHSRVRGSGSGFAEGGYTGGGTVQNNIVIDAKAIGTAVADAVGDTLAKKPLRSYVVRNDIKEIDDQDARFKKQTSR